MQPVVLVPDIEDAMPSRMRRTLSPEGTSLWRFVATEAAAYDRLRALALVFFVLTTAPAFAESSRKDVRGDCERLLATLKDRDIGLVTGIELPLRQVWGEEFAEHPLLHHGFAEIGEGDPQLIHLVQQHRRDSSADDLVGLLAQALWLTGKQREELEGTYRNRLPLRTPIVSVSRNDTRLLEIALMEFDGGDFSAVLTSEQCETWKQLRQNFEMGRHRLEALRPCGIQFDFDDHLR